jgi:uncharacterized protein YaaQ
MLGRCHRQGIGGSARGRLDDRDVALGQAAASKDVAPRPIVVRGHDQRERRPLTLDGASQDHVERGIEAVAAADGTDGPCQRVGVTGWIERAHEASTSGSSGVPATQAGIARMIRALHRGKDPVERLRPAKRSPAPGAPPILGRVKLVVAIVHTEDAGHLVDGLLEREFRATRLHSSGGFLKQSNATVILGVEDDQVEAALAVIRDNCHSRTQLVNPMPPIMEPGEFFLPYPLEVEVGGATVFVLPVERFERI